MTAALKQSSTKKRVYITFFTLLGALIGFVIWGLGCLILLKHNRSINTTLYLWIMLVAGTVAGYLEGRRWWRIIYIEKAYLRWPKHRFQYKLIGVAILLILTIAIVAFFGNYLT